MTDHLVERVAQAICDARYPHQAASTVRAAESLMLARAAIAAIREAEPTTQLRNILGDIRDFCTDEADHRDIDRLASWALDLLAEPLTSSPQLSTTETGCQPIIQLGAGLTGSPLGPQQFDPPPGYEYEYRTRHAGRPGHWSGWLKLRPLSTRGWLLERRLVGPPERIEEE